MANGQTFYLLNELAGWRELAPPAGIALGETLSLQPLPGDANPLADAQGGFSGLALPSALALDRTGRIYVLDGEQIWRYDPCVACFEALAHIGGKGCQPRRFERPSGIAISCRDDLYIAERGNRRVQVFAIKGLALRQIWGPLRVVQAESGWKVQPVQAEQAAATDCLPPAEATYPSGTWEPADIAITPDRRAFVSDRLNGLVHVFDARGRWKAAWDGQDENGVGLASPTHLALDQRGYLYIVQEGLPDVVILDENGKFAGRVQQPSQVEVHFIPGAIGFDPQGRLHLLDARTGCVWVYDESQSGACACRLPRANPCAIAFDGDGCVLLADKLAGLVYSLQPGVAYPAEGVFIAGPLDSERFRCQWHRVKMQARVDPGTSIQVETFTSEAPKAAVEVQLLPDNRWATQQVNGQPGEGEWDCLVRSQPGRYLWLRLTLRGDGRHTPQIGSLQIEYPRNSSLRHLPAVFRQDAASADFLERYLSLMDKDWEGLGASIDHIDWYFDPNATPLDFLAWLASWLGLALEQSWPEARRRKLVEQAHRLYALRGTPAGLRLHVAIYTGVEPQILEHFKLRRWLVLSQARLGEASVLWGADVVDRLQLGVNASVGDFKLQDTGDPQRDPFHVYAHQFSLYIILPGADEAQVRTLERIVELSKPAHSQGNIVLVEPRLRIGRQSIVGVNTVVGCYPAGVTTGESRLGEGTLLSPSADEALPPRARVGKSTRLGSGTAID